MVLCESFQKKAELYCCKYYTDKKFVLVDYLKGTQF